MRVFVSRFREFCLLTFKLKKNKDLSLKQIFGKILAIALTLLEFTKLDSSIKIMVV